MKVVNSAEEKNDETKKSNNQDDVMSIFTKLTKNSKKGKKAEWEELTIVDAFEDCTPATEEQIQLIEEKIARYNITLQEIEIWKNENSEKYAQLTSGDNVQEFKTLMKIVEGVMKKRKDLQETNIEVEQIANDLDLCDTDKNTVKAEPLGSKDSQNQRAVNPICITPSQTSKNKESKETGFCVGEER